MNSSKYTRVEKLLDWLLDKGMEDRRVSLGCKDCNQSLNLLASVARGWLPAHRNHAVWIRNPFTKRLTHRA